MLVLGICQELATLLVKTFQSSSLDSAEIHCFGLPSSPSVDGSEIHLGYIKPCKSWDKLPICNWFYGFLPATVWKQNCSQNCFRWQRLNLEFLRGSIMPMVLNSSHEPTSLSWRATTGVMIGGRSEVLMFAKLQHCSTVQHSKSEIQFQLLFCWNTKLPNWFLFNSNLMFFSCCRHVVTIFSAPNYCYRLGTAETSFLDLMAIGDWVVAIYLLVQFQDEFILTQVIELCCFAWVLDDLRVSLSFWGVAIKQLSWKLMNTWSRSAAYLSILVKMVWI